MVCSKVYIYHLASLNIKAFTGALASQEKKKKKSTGNPFAYPMASVESISVTFFCSSTNFLQTPATLLFVGLPPSNCD